MILYCKQIEFQDVFYWCKSWVKSKIEDTRSVARWRGSVKWDLLSLKCMFRYFVKSSLNRCLFPRSLVLFCFESKMGFCYLILSLQNLRLKLFISSKTKWFDLVFIDIVCLLVFVLVLLFDYFDCCCVGALIVIVLSLIWFYENIFCMETQKCWKRKKKHIINFLFVYIVYVIFRLYWIYLNYLKTI
jgi:hypothetical protein